MNGYEVCQTFKEPTEDICYKIHNFVQSFVLLSYTIRDLCLTKTFQSIGLFLSQKETTTLYFIGFLCLIKTATKTNSTKIFCKGSKPFPSNNNNIHLHCTINFPIVSNKSSKIAIKLN